MDKQIPSFHDFYEDWPRGELFLQRDVELALKPLELFTVAVPKDRLDLLVDDVHSSAFDGAKLSQLRKCEISSRGVNNLGS